MQGTNQIGDAGAKAMASALKKNSSLQYLSLVRRTLAFLMLLNHRFFCPSVRRG
jgi:hypothetical protein